MENEEKQEQKKKKRKSKRKNNGCLIIIVAIVFIISIGGTIAYISLEKYIPNMKAEEYYDYFDDLKKDQLYIVLEDERLDTDNPPIIENGEIFLPVDFVKEHLDKYIFWDETTSKLTITTEHMVMRMKTDDLTYYVNDKPFQLNLPVHNREGVAYMSAGLLEELYHVTVTYKDKYKLAVVDYNDHGKQMGKVASKKTNLRYKPDIKSPIEEKLLMDDLLILYEEFGDFVKVRDTDGVLGYALKKDLEETEMRSPIEKEQLETPKPAKPIDGMIYLLWDQILKPEANSLPSRRIYHEGVNVLSPTWFSFDEKMNGDILNIADLNYVRWAHDQGYQVWALITDNFNFDVSHAVLSDTDIREHVIKQLLAFISMYELDGINIDFEAIREADAVYYLQFLRELAPLVREQGAVLSVDMFVPLYTRYYNRTEVGKVVDYVCVMTYDEHTSVSPVTGPVASLDFVKTGILDTLEEVPNEKVVMGIPFYIRIWKEKEENGEIIHTHKDYDMDTAYQIFIDNGAEFHWAADTGCYYAEYEAEDEGETVTYKVWLEDERSIEEKMKLFKTLDVAGVACWKRGLEKDGVIELIASYLKDSNETTTENEEEAKS